MRGFLVLALVAAACSDRPPSVAKEPRNTVPEWFTDGARESGLDFVHFNGMSGALYYAEHMGPGVALFDYDNDGDLDVFIPQGQMLGTGRKVEQALFPPKGPLPVRGRLFRNDLTVNADGTHPSTGSGRPEHVEGRTLKFTDVTDASGINANAYGMGVATGDFDNDGCIDLYVTTRTRIQEPNQNEN